MERNFFREIKIKIFNLKSKKYKLRINKAK